VCFWATKLDMPSSRICVCRALWTPRILFGTIHVDRVDLVNFPGELSPLPGLGRSFNCFLAGDGARDNLAATSTGSQMSKDRFALARRERAAHECRNILVAYMPGFFLTRALLRHACIPIWPADLIMPAWSKRTSQPSLLSSYAPFGISLSTGVSQLDL
jgi:hypothetical protein